MNFEDFEKTWARQLVVGAPISVEMVQHQLKREVRQRSARVRRIIGVAAFVFVMAWGLAAVVHFTGIKPLDPTGARWLAVVLGVDLLFFVLAFRSLRRNRREEARMGESLVDAVRGSLRVVEWQIRDCVLLAYGAAVALGGSGALTVLKSRADELPPAALIASFALDAALVLGVLLTLRRYFRRDLQPRREDLQEQLRELQTGPVENVVA